MILCQFEALEWHHISVLTIVCAAEQDKWKVGKVEVMQPSDDSPFLGEFECGSSQLAVETGMYRAPGFAYSTSATDFLLIRNAAGAIMLRELTGCIAVGQQLPLVRVPVPFSNSREVRSAFTQTQASVLCWYATMY